LFIFFYGKENETKEIAPCDAAHGPALRFSNRAVAVKLANASDSHSSLSPDSAMPCASQWGIFNPGPLEPSSFDFRSL